ncbi:Six-bladed beta-propeller, TolB-like protein [Melia azedarach]|uniref:Six-bladed beta-propeller, TolB-like protein n=1 Tax=Melia azedarach TaxID=155640 RepID=A0ACC1XF89_MELAZ|nr:Six-bladed beta-propeller, TolB-like protein [Melia azedarach]
MNGGMEPKRCQHFVVGSLRHRSIHSVSDAAVLETLVSDQTLPENATFLGLTIDSTNNRLLAVVQSFPPLLPFNALAAYDLRTRSRVFLAVLDDDSGTVITTTRHGANDVAVDFQGNAYVTNSIGNFIWKVDKDGEATVFSRSPVFTAYPLAVDPDAPFSECGLNGVAYVSKGYLLVVQSNTGKMYKVNADDGSARRVLLNEDLIWADDIAIRSDGVVLVVSTHTLWFIKSHDSWAEGVVFDKIALDEKKFATSVVIGGGNRAYVLYGHVMEGIMGNSGREEFSIVETKSKEESNEENVWIFVLIGLGLAYFLFWRFQMNKLVKNLDRKNN